MKGAATSSAVLDMLREDHAKVKDLFEEFENAEDSREKSRIVQTALMELELHAKLEEQVIYPALREQLEDDELMAEAVEEHHVVHVLIREIKTLKPSDERFDAKFSVLSESVKHHIQEEEGTMFPQAEEAEIDWEALQEEVLKKKDRLLSRNGGASTRNGRKKR
jgi:hemerythrin-like domain-containing protein